MDNGEAEGGWEGWAGDMQIECRNLNTITLQQLRPVVEQMILCILKTKS
jgi:hypothetical protein